MFIDSIVMIAVIMAMITGFRRGLIMSIVNGLSLVLALVIAVKFSTLASPKLAESFQIPAHYLPWLSFLVVFIVSLVGVRMIGRLVQKSMETMHLGMLNRLGGAAWYTAVYLAVVSVALFYLSKMGTFSPMIAQQSVTYSYVAPWGPGVVEAVGRLIPWFADMFGDISAFFDDLKIKYTPQ